jgi:hypothetical protein
MPEEYMTIAEAQSRLGISKSKMADLIDEEVILVTTNPLDKRSKLVRIADVEALLASGELSRRKKESNYQYMSVRIARRLRDGKLYAELVNKGDGNFFPADRFVEDPEAELTRYLSALEEGWHIVATLSWTPISYSFNTNSERIDYAELLLERQSD